MSDIWQELKELAVRHPFTAWSLLARQAVERGEQLEADVARLTKERNDARVGQHQSYEAGYEQGHRAGLEEGQACPAK